MRWVKVSDSFFNKCKANGVDNNSQLLHNEKGRPSVLLLNLLYKGKYYDFVVPMKSNINPAENKKNYFPLPPNSKTRSGFHHGIYYIKLFPISLKYVQPYHYDKNPYLCSIKRIIDKKENTKEIVTACQEYLNDYSLGNKHNFTPNIDEIISILNI